MVAALLFTFHLVNVSSMNSSSNKTDFSTLLSYDKAKALLRHLNALNCHGEKNSSISSITEREENFRIWKNSWEKLSAPKVGSEIDRSFEDDERAATTLLIQLFNTLFSDQKVILARSTGEPEYFPACNDQPARIEFAHGFFASALHEISHWCVAGKTRRTLSDFGYWYAPDGRSATQQQAFERVEIKPQALECLFTLACGRPFQVSQDNLFATFDTSTSTFADDVYQQAEAYIANPSTLPRDAQVLLCTFLSICPLD